MTDDQSAVGTSHERVALSSPMHSAGSLFALNLISASSCAPLLLTDKVSGPLGLYWNSGSGTSLKRYFVGLPWWLSGKEPSCQRRRHGFDAQSGKIPHAVE